MSHIAGTTRDFVDAYFNCQGIILHLIDTAGIHHTTDPIEKIGITRTKKLLSQAQLVLLVLDQSEVLQPGRQAIIRINQKSPSHYYCQQSRFKNFSF